MYIQTQAPHMCMHMHKHTHACAHTHLFSPLGVFWWAACTDPVSSSPRLSSSDLKQMPGRLLKLQLVLEIPDNCMFLLDRWQKSSSNAYIHKSCSKKQRLANSSAQIKTMMNKIHSRQPKATTTKFLTQWICHLTMGSIP